MGEQLLEHEHDRVLPEVELVTSRAEIAEHGIIQGLCCTIIVPRCNEEEQTHNKCKEEHTAEVEEASFFKH